MDDFLQGAPWHSGVSDVLLWQARLYERTGILHAARTTYTELIENYPSASCMDEALLEAAHLAIRVKRPEEAVNHLRQYLQEYPGTSRSGEAKLALGRALVQAGRVDEGNDLLIGVAKTHSSTALGAKAFAQLGEVAFDDGRYDEAIRLLETRLETATTTEGNEQVYLLLAKAYRMRNQSQEAERVLRELIDFFPETEATPQAFIELSRVLDDRGMRREAVRLASQAARRYPTNPDVLRNKAHLLSLSGNERAAAETLVEADRAGANDPAILLDAGRYYHKAGDLDGARDTFEHLIRTYPSSSAAFEGSIALARVFRDQDKPRKALEKLDDLAKLSEGRPQRLPVLIALGQLYQDLGLIEQASETFAQVAVVTTEPEVLARSALALFHGGNVAQAIAVANRIDVHRLTDPTAYALLTTHGEHLLRADAASGVAKLRQAFDEYPGQRTPEGNECLLRAYLITDRIPQARALVQTIQAHVRKNPVDTILLQRAANLLGDHLYQRRDFRAAAETYRAALPATGPPNAHAQWARYQRANALLHAAEFEESIKLFDAVAAGSSPWSEEAATKASYARLEQRLRGIDVTPAPSQGG